MVVPEIALTLTLTLSTSIHRLLTLNQLLRFSFNNPNPEPPTPKPKPDPSCMYVRTLKLPFCVQLSITLNPVVIPMSGGAELWWR